MYTDQFLRPPGTILIGLKIKIFDLLAYLTQNLYHETSHSSSNYIGQYSKIACIYEWITFSYEPFKNTKNRIKKNIIVV